MFILWVNGFIVWFIKFILKCDIVCFMWVWLLLDIIIIEIFVVVILFNYVCILVVLFGLF